MLVSAQILPGCVQYSDFGTDFRSIVSAITLHGSLARIPKRNIPRLSDRHLPALGVAAAGPSKVR